MKKIRRSFVIRWILSPHDEKQPESSVIDVEHIQTGNHRRVTSLVEANAWMTEVTDQSPTSAAIKAATTFNEFSK